jgi:hypothetical protein
MLHICILTSLLDVFYKLFLLDVFAMIKFQKLSLLVLMIFTINSITASSSNKDSLKGSYQIDKDVLEKLEAKRGILSAPHRNISQEEKDKSEADISGYFVKVSNLFEFEIRNKNPNITRVVIDYFNAHDIDIVEYCKQDPKRFMTN